MTSHQIFSFWAPKMHFFVSNFRTLCTKACLTFINPLFVNKKSCPDGKKSCHQCLFKFKIPPYAPQIASQYAEIVTHFFTTWNSINLSKIMSRCIKTVTLWFTYLVSSISIIFHLITPKNHMNSTKNHRNN